MVTWLRVWFVVLCLGVAGVAQAAPAEVQIGIYVNDLHRVDLANHSFVIDMYAWFRWQDPELDPGSTFELMNSGDPEYQLREQFYDEPLEQPDGYLYQLYRYRGEIATKFPVAKYPFDHQVLQVWIEDQDRGSDEQIYVFDELTLRPDIVLPGYDIGDAELLVVDQPYATAFGDRAEADVGAYSRAILAIDIDRPWRSGATKTFLPMVLIILCSAAAFLIGAQHVEARIGLAITSLLALVAQQFSMLGTLPEVGYLLMLDQLYILSYGFVLVTIVVIVRENLQAERAGPNQPRRPGLARAVAALTVYTLLTATIVWLNLADGG